MLRYKINGAILLTFVVIAGVFALLQRPFERQRAQVIMRKAQSVLDTLAVRDADPLANAIVDHRLREIRLRLQQMLAVDGILAISVFDQTGRLLLAEGEQPRSAELSVAEQRLTDAGAHLSTARANGLQRLNYLRDIRVIGKRYGFLHAAYSLAELDQERRRVWALFGSLLGAMLSVMLLTLNLLLSRAIIRPVHDLRRAMQRMQMGAPGEQVRIVSGGELGELAQTFNVMSQALQRHQAERDRLNEQLHRRELAEAANRAKSEFLRTISHEIRTPVHAIILGLGHVSRHPDLPEPLAGTLRRIDAAARMLHNLVNGVLDLSSIESGKFALRPEHFDLREVVRTMSDLFAFERAPDVQWELSIQPDIPEWLYGDCTRLTQVLSNLVSNAVKFTKQGRIRVNVTRHASDAPPRSDPARPGESIWLHFAIHDTGIGIAPDDQAHIFEPFFQSASPQGKKTGGMGLTIVERIVTALGGVISLQSQPGVGTQVEVALPFGKGDAAQARLADEIPALPRRADSNPSVPLRVLIVEDNQSSRSILIEALQAAGCEAVGVDCGETALEHWAQAPYDVILMDLGLPGLSGLETAQAIRRLEARRGGGQAYIVALTASAMTEDRDTCLQAGLDAFWPKPLDDAALLRRLKSVFPTRPIWARRTDRPAHSDPTAAYAELPLHLERLPESCRTDPAKLRRYLDLLRQDIQQAVNGIEQALQQGEPAALAQAAHKLNGAIGKIRSDALREQAARLEDCGRRGQLTEAPAIFAQLHDTLAVVLWDASF